MITLYVFFTSCSKDDEENRNILGTGGAATTVDGKRLVKMVNSNEKESTSYEYNSSGQISMVSYDEGKYLDSYSYDNNHNIITFSSSRYSSSKGEYTLSNGRIIKAVIEWSNSTSEYSCKEEYEYNEDGYLDSIHSIISTKEKSTKITTSIKTDQTTYFTWIDGNLVNEKTSGKYKSEKWKLVGYNVYNGEYLPIHQGDTFEKEIEIRTEYTYTEHPNVLPEFSSGTNSILGWQGYYGKSSKNLPTKVVTRETDTYFNGYENTSSFKKNTITYDYTFNGNLVTKLTGTINDKKDNTYTINYTWE